MEAGKATLFIESAQPIQLPPLNFELFFYSIFHLVSSNVKEMKCVLTMAFIAVILLSQSFLASTQQRTGIQSRALFTTETREIGVQIKRRVCTVPAYTSTGAHARPKSSAIRNDKSMF